MKQKRIAFALIVISIILTSFACMSGPSDSVQAPIAISGIDLPKYSMQEIYDSALETSANMVKGKMTTRSWIYGIAWACIVLAVGILISGSNIVGLLITAGVSFIVFLFAFFNVYHEIPSKVDEIGHLQANIAANAGIEKAQKEQASNFQYIAATLNKYGYQIMTCSDPINHYADCSEATSYYTNKDVNCRTVCRSHDEDGNCTSWGEECDTMHVSWFPYLVRYYVAPATRAKYIFEGIYDFRCINPDTNSLEDCHRDDNGIIDDKRQPAVYVNADWRPPVGAQIRDKAKSFYSTYEYNDHIPTLYTAMKNVGSGKTITAYFVGKYFHWGFAADSPRFVTYEGPYRDLKNLVTLPGPNGVWFNYTDGYGHDVSMNTLLFSKDNDLATMINPVFFLGFENVDPSKTNIFEEKAREFQGTFGPGKESINYLAIVNKDIVTQMGGIVNTTAGVMGWLQDETVWGLFRMPKNQTVVVVAASPDLSTYDEVNFDTGIPFGNELVKQRIRMSVTQSQPLTWDNLMGPMSSNYILAEEVKLELPGQNWLNTLNFIFSDMTQAGKIIGLIYENNLPEYKDKYPQPDPNNESCETALPEHVGYIRYQMCTQQYLQTTIKINENGRTLIMNMVTNGSNEAVNNSSAGWFLAIIIVISIFVVGLRLSQIQLY